MKDKSYGQLAQSSVNGIVEQHAERLSTCGYTVLEGVVSPAELEVWRRKIDAVYAQQETEFGREFLAAIQEIDVCRAPLLYDREFIGLAAVPRVLDIVRILLGEWFIINLQNAIINRPNISHHQNAWHRDLPHQNFTVSHPIAINALFAIDDFSEETGGTQILPFSHKMEALPSDAYIDMHKLTVAIPAGSVVLFDAMLLHRAGSNRSNITRRGVNHLYTIPIIKQQYDFPRALGGEEGYKPEIARLLGFTSQTPLDDRAWREARSVRLGISSRGNGRHG